MARPRPHTPIFPSILCGADNGAGGIAARRQAAWLAEGEGVLEVVTASALTGLEPPVLIKRCAPHDLLVLPSTPEAHRLAACSGVPVLLAGWGPDDKDLTDEILVVAGDHAAAMAAARFAAVLARRFRGSVSIVAAPPRSRELGRAMAASSRIVLSTTGSAPRLLGEVEPPQRAVTNAAAAVGASLLVLGVSSSSAAAPVADLARFAGCSVLVAPAPVATARRFVPSEAPSVVVRAPAPAHA